MTRSLVAYFSASGNTKIVASNLADACGADSFEIKPVIPYTRADLNWMDKQSRSSIEMNDPSSRPEIAEKISNAEKYEVVFIGFPIWWYTAPTIIKTFLESYDFTGKMIVPFATSGGSGLGDTCRILQGIVPTSKVMEGKMFNGNVSLQDMKRWINMILL